MIVVTDAVVVVVAVLVLVLMSPAPSSNPPLSPIVVVDVVGTVRRKVIVDMLSELCVTVEVAICSFNQVV